MSSFPKTSSCAVCPGATAAQWENLAHRARIVLAMPGMSCGLPHRFGIPGSPARWEMFIVPSNRGIGISYKITYKYRRADQPKERSPPLGCGLPPHLSSLFSHSFYPTCICDMGLLLCLKPRRCLPEQSPTMT